MMGEGSGASGFSVTSAAAVAAAVIVVAEIAMIAGAAVHATAGSGVAAAVVLIVRVDPGRSRVHGLHRDLGSGLGCCVEGLGPGIIFCPELHCGLHSNLGLLGKAMTRVGRRRAVVVWGRCLI